MRMLQTVVRSAALMALIAATAFLLVRHVAVPFLCQHMAAVGATRLDWSMEQSTLVSERVARGMLGPLRSCASDSPWESSVHLTLGRVADAAGDHAMAISEYQQALVTDRRPEIYLALGLAQMASLDRPGAIASLVRACAFDPSRLVDIPYDDVRAEVTSALKKRYGKHWIH